MKMHQEELFVALEIKSKKKKKRLDSKLRL